MKNWISISLLCLGLLMTNLTQADSKETKARQQLFTHIEEQSEVLEDLVDDEDWQRAGPLALELANEVAKLNNLFPESSKDEGRSRDGIWEEWPEFSKRLEKFEKSYNDVASAIEKGNYNQAENALDKATSSCRSCHMSYRSLW